MDIVGGKRGTPQTRGEDVQLFARDAVERPHARLEILRENVFGRVAELICQLYKAVI